MSLKLLRIGVAAAALASLFGCGGGDAGELDLNLSSDDLRAMALAVTPRQRIQAATATANSDVNACAGIRPFYWEIGNRSNRLASGSIASSTGVFVYDSKTAINLGSASKWLYGAYFVQRRQGVLGAADLKLLQMKGGYHSMGTCYQYQTVGTCFRYDGNDAYDPAADGKFYYDGGHFQKHAVDIGLGSLDRDALTSEVMTQLGTAIPLGYGVPATAGGGRGTPDGFAQVLRKMMRGELLLGTMLGSNPVCTNPATCPPGEALYSPNPSSESWHYSIAHWVEDDPVSGDGSFSSPGRKGFYPWIDASRTVYGIIAREVEGGYLPSVECGRLVRKAWQSGIAQQ